MSFLSLGLENSISGNISLARIKSAPGNPGVYYFHQTNGI